MSNLKNKLAKLRTARSERDFELAIYNNLESKNGPGDKEAEAHNAANVDPLHDKVANAEPLVTFLHGKPQAQSGQRV